MLLSSSLFRFLNGCLLRVVSVLLLSFLEARLNVVRSFINEDRRRFTEGVLLRSVLASVDLRSLIEGRSLTGWRPA
jgi:hypothetical protein